MAQVKMPDRRRSTRVAVDLWVAERTGEALYLECASNLSIEGLFIDKILPHAPGTRVELDLDLPGQEQPLTIEGEVITAAREGMGVRFVGLTTRDRVRLAECIFGDDP